MNDQEDKWDALSPEERLREVDKVLREMEKKLRKPRVPSPEITEPRVRLLFSSSDPDCSQKLDALVVEIEQQQKGNER